MFESKPVPGLKPLNSAVIAKVTDEERIAIGQMAGIWEMSVSEFVRFSTLRYLQQIVERATGMAMADVAIEESRHRAALDAKRVRVPE